MKYVLAARIFHWLMAIGFLFMWSCGFAMTTFVEEDSALQDSLIGLHISIGVTLLALLIGRIVVRLIFKPPPLPAAISLLEQVASKAAHAALYVLPVAIISFGWASVNMGGHVVHWFGADLPILFSEGEDELVEVLHKWLAYAMLFVVVCHLAAVVKHRWIDGDDVLHRMV